MTEQEQIIEDFKNHGLDDKTLARVLRGINDIKEGRTYTTEEVYKSILKHKEICYT